MENDYVKILRRFQNIDQVVRDAFHLFLPYLGGTNIHMPVYLYNIDFTENEEDTACRKELEKLAEEKGNVFLHKMLAEVDEKSALAIHENNRKRVIRALEFYRMTGKKISEHNEAEREKKAAYNACYFVLTDDRSLLYDRIDRRVDHMIREGLVEEVTALKKMGCTKEMVSMQGLGYKEILSCLEGDITLDRAIYLIKRDTRHFAFGNIVDLYKSFPEFVQYAFSIR